MAGSIEEPFDKRQAAIAETAREEKLIGPASYSSAMYRGERIYCYTDVYLRISEQDSAAFLWQARLSTPWMKMKRM